MEKQVYCRESFC